MNWKYLRKITSIGDGSVQVRGQCSSTSIKFRLFDVGPWTFGLGVSSVGIFNSPLQVNLLLVCMCAHAYVCNPSPASVLRGPIICPVRVNATPFVLWRYVIFSAHCCVCALYGIKLNAFHCSKRVNTRFNLMVLMSGMTHSWPYVVFTVYTYTKACNNTATCCLCCVAVYYAFQSCFLLRRKMNVWFPYLY